MRPRFRTKFVIRGPNRELFPIANLADINARVIDFVEIRRNTAGPRKMQSINDDAGILSARHRGNPVGVANRLDSAKRHEFDADTNFVRGRQRAEFCQCIRECLMLVEIDIEHHELRAEVCRRL